MPASTLSKIVVKVSAPNNNAFGAMKLFFSDGQESEEFCVQNTNWRVTKELIIDPERRIRKIAAHGRHAEPWGDILDLSLYDEANGEIAKVFAGTHEQE